MDRTDFLRLNTNPRNLNAYTPWDSIPYHEKFGMKISRTSDTRSLRDQFRDDEIRKLNRTNIRFQDIPRQY
jgi:hypothetical protein